MANENTEISQKRTLLRADLSDNQSQELLKQIQKRVNLPYIPEMDIIQDKMDTTAEKEITKLHDAFELEMGPLLEKEMTPQAKALMDQYKEYEAMKNIKRERAKVTMGLGLRPI